MAKYKLDELCEFITDGTHQTPEYCEKEGIIFLSSKDVTERKIDWNNVKYIPVSLHEKLCKRLKPRKNDILLAKNGTTGVAAIVDRDEFFDVYVSLAVLRPLDNIYPRYLLYAINSPVAKKQFDAGLKGIGVPNLHLGVIRETVVNIVPRNEQEKICEILDRVENVINERKQELIALDNLIKGRFVEMFGSIHESTEYPYVAVKDLTDVISGGTPSRDKAEYWEGGTIPWVKTTELQNNNIVNTDEYITEAGLNGSSAKLVPVGTVLVAMYGQGKTRGMTAYLNIEACTNQACACILPSDRIDSMFMWKFFELSYEKLRSLAQGAGQPNLNGNMIKNFQVLVPPIEQQKEYVDFVGQIDKSKVAVQKALEETQLLFDSLMQQYFG